jgi:hypothetical protein
MLLMDDDADVDGDADRNDDGFYVFCGKIGKWLFTQHQKA